MPFLVWFLPQCGVSLLPFGAFSLSLPAKCFQFLGNSGAVRRALFFWCLLNEVSLQGQTQPWQNVQILPFESVHCVFLRSVSDPYPKAKAQSMLKPPLQRHPNLIKGFHSHVMSHNKNDKNGNKKKKSKKSLLYWGSPDFFQSSSNNCHYFVDR